MAKPEQDQIDAEFEKARWVSLKLPAMVTAEEVRFGRKVWRLGYLAGAITEREAVLEIITRTENEASLIKDGDALYFCRMFADRIRQRGEAGEGKK